MERFYGTAFDRFERYTPFGTAEQVAASLAPYVDGGRDHAEPHPVRARRDTEVELTAEVKRLLDR
jgi:hypothetical protein